MFLDTMCQWKLKVTNAVSVVNRPNEADIPLNEEKATPTRSQMKIEELCKFMKNSDT